MKLKQNATVSRQCIWKWRLQAESHFTWPICIKSTFYPGHNVLTNCILQCPHETKHQMAFWLPLWKFLIRFSFSNSMFNQNHSCLTIFNLSVMYQNVAYLYFFVLFVSWWHQIMCVKHARRKCSHSVIKSVVWIVRSLTMPYVFN